MCIHFGRRRDNSAWDAVNCMLCPRQVKSTTVQFHAQCVSRIAPPRTKALILMICWFRALVGRSDGFQHLGQVGEVGIIRMSRRVHQLLVYSRSSSQ